MTARSDEAAAPTRVRVQVARGLLGLALAYSVALIAAGFLVPVYAGTSASSDGTVTHTSATLVEVNGVNVLIVLAIPLLVTIAVAIALRWGASNRRLALAWALTAGIAVLTLLAMMSIGVFLLPVTIALAAVNLTVRGEGPQRGDPIDGHIR